MRVFLNTGNLELEGHVWLASTSGVGVPPNYPDFTLPARDITPSYGPTFISAAATLPPANHRTRTPELSTATT